MERKPLTNSVESSDNEGSDKTDSEKATSSKKKTLRHVPLAAPSKEKSADESVVEKSKKDLFDFAEKSSESEDKESLEPSTEEIKHVTKEVARDHLESMQDVDDETAEVLEPATEFLERVQQGEDPEAAFSQVANELGMEAEEITEALTETEPDMDSEDGELQVDDSPEDFTEDNDEVEVDLSASTGGGAGSGSGSGGRGSAVPPAGSSSSGSGGGSAAAMPVMGLAGGSAAAKPNTMPTAANTYYDNRRNRTGELLVVGLVGFLYGRRRGRIKAEKKLLPVQKKLEKQVKSLEQSITFKEQKLVAAKARLQESAKRAPAERPAPTELRMQPSRTESRLGVEKPVHAEQLGHMIIAAEAPKAKTTEQKAEKLPNNIREAFRPEEVRDMRRNELLELSEKIIVEGASLRRIYESRLIGEKQLRHLVSEYLKGKDIHKDLRREMVEHEIDFERDPILRDRVRSHLQGNKGGGGLSDLLASVGIVDEEPNAELEHRIKKEAARREAQEQKLKQQRVTTDIAMVTAVVVLAIVVAILALRG